MSYFLIYMMLNFFIPTQYRTTSPCISTDSLHAILLFVVINYSTSQSNDKSKVTITIDLNCFDERFTPNRVLYERNVCQLSFMEIN